MDERMEGDKCNDRRESTWWRVSKRRSAVETAMEY